MVPLIVENGVPIVVCVRQYRPVLDQWVLEIPAGMRDVPGEALELTASRELAEEAGLIAGRLHHLTDFFPSAGMTDSVLHLYLATELRQSERDLHGPEESHMEVVRLTLDDAVQQVLSGDIKDAKTVIGVLLVDRRWREGTIDAAAGG